MWTSYVRQKKRVSYELAGIKLLENRARLILLRNGLPTARTISSSAHKERKF